ncbi:MAG TPA: hypothetical protein VFX18_03250 [Candidatus Nitrosocosmicus sp.]|nr:hypothetical protein [Candidatus Nitrosocosmicus sp.]
MNKPKFVKYQSFDGRVIEARNVLIVKRSRNKTNKCKCNHPHIADGYCHFGRCRHEVEHHHVMRCLF